MIVCIFTLMFSGSFHQTLEYLMVILQLSNSNLFYLDNSVAAVKLNLLLYKINWLIKKKRKEIYVNR